MRVPRIVLCCITLAAVLNSCKKEETTSVEQKLIGSWDTDFAASDADRSDGLDEPEKAYFRDTSHFMYNFKSDGSLTTGTSGGAQEKYSWTLSGNGNSIRLVPEDDTNDRIYYRIHTLTSTGLILEDTPASGILAWVGMIKQQ